MGGGNNIEFGWDTEVNPLLTHNASLTSWMLSATVKWKKKKKKKRY